MISFHSAVVLKWQANIVQKRNSAMCQRGMDTWDQKAESCQCGSSKNNGRASLSRPKTASQRV